MKKYLFLVLWLVIALMLAFISLTYTERSDALAAEVESQVTAISFQKPVIVRELRVFPGQEVLVGDTLLIVSRPDLALDIERKENEIRQVEWEQIALEEDFKANLYLLQLDIQGRINSLNADRAELVAEQQAQKRLRGRLEELQGTAYPVAEDSAFLVRLEALKVEEQELRIFQSRQISIRQRQLQERKSTIQQEMDLLQTELQTLKLEQSTLVKRASFHGTIGTLSVQLDELVPPFKTLLTVYELRPSMIKAYKHERMESPVQVGDQVRVVSENRQYSIFGTVVELGARITAFPSKIQPQPGTIIYGQEIFVRIPSENRFLNGEKVFVYPMQQNERN